MLTGSCLCGAIQYQLNSSIDTLVFCHCTRCRKQTGSAFNSATLIDRTNLTFIAGESLLKVFAYHGVNRHFCSECGSHLLSSRDNDVTTYRLRVGTINEPIYPKTKCHIFTASKANWDQICDNNPQYEEMIK